MVNRAVSGKSDAKTGQSGARLRLRLMFDDLEGGNADESRKTAAYKAMLGPGKADLLERIGETGSIAGAGRAMGMSYQRAWMLVETMNTIFAEPLVESSRGGSAGGGAELTQAGRKVLSLYRALEQRTLEAGNAEVEAICALLKPRG